MGKGSLEHPAQVRQGFGRKTAAPTGKDLLGLDGC